jgi:hypothetical protein
MLGLTACGSTEEQSNIDLTTNVASTDAAISGLGEDTIGTPAVASKNLPANYVKALSCDFDEKLAAAVQTYHHMTAGRAEREPKVTLLKSLGFMREGRDGDLESVGGKIALPAGLSVHGLPPQSVESNGAIGDANAMHITVFADSVAVNEIAKATHLQIDFESRSKYKLRHYSREVSNNPFTQLYLDDRIGGHATLVCQFKGTPDC